MNRAVIAGAVLLWKAPDFSSFLGNEIGARTVPCLMCWLPECLLPAPHRGQLYLVQARHLVGTRLPGFLDAAAIPVYVKFCFSN
jgi:hypothetical protein